MTSSRYISDPPTYPRYHILQSKIKESKFCRFNLLFLAILAHFLIVFGNAHWLPQNSLLILCPLGTLVTINIWVKFEVNRTYGSGVMVICFFSEYWKMKIWMERKKLFFERFDNALLMEIGTPLYFSKGCTALEWKRTLKIHFLLFLDTPIKLLSSNDILSNAWLKFELNWKRRTDVTNFQSLAFYNIDLPFNYTFTHKLKLRMIGEWNFENQKQIFLNILSLEWQIKIVIKINLLTIENYG